MQSPVHRSLGLVLGIALLLACCGGGGGGGGDEPLYTAFHAAPEYDGVALSSGSVFFRPEEAFIFTGDLEGSYSPGYRGRQVFAFHLGTPPVGVRVLRAELRLYQAVVEGSPFEKNGDVVVDHVDYVRDPGPDTYDGQNLTRNVGTLSEGPALGLRTLDVTEAVRDDLAAGRPWSQFRTRFWQPIVLPILDHVNDYMRFTLAEGHPSGELPTLVVFYE
jgi:hypothetical protein